MLCFCGCMPSAEMSNSPKIVGRVSPAGRNPTSNGSAHGDVGLRQSVVSLSNHEAANPTYRGVAGDEWKSLSIADAPIEIVDGDRGVNYPKQDDFSSVGHCLFLNTGNVTTTGFSFSDRSFITKEKDDTLRKGKLKRHDVVLTTRGTVGNTALFDESAPFEHVRINSGMVLLRADQTKLLPRFLYLFVRSPNFKEQVASLSTGSAQPQLPIRDIRRVQIPLPPIPEQKAIAHILGTLDDKIELNRRTNATLEAMARALFQSWFVDFDPVRAKLDGRQPAGLDAVTAALFPAHFQDPPLGHIPQGWEVRSLDQIAHFLNGLALQKYPPGDGATLPVIKIAQLRKGDSEGADRCNTELAPQYIVEDGDVLFSWSGSLEVELWCGGRGALNQHLFKVTSPEFPKWFYYFWTRYHLDEFRLIAAGKATTMGHIQRGHLTAAKVFVPPPDLLKAMNLIMAPLIDQIIGNRTQSRTLATLRDVLLPKLLSGELSVSDRMAEIAT